MSLIDRMNAVKSAEVQNADVGSGSVLDYIVNIPMSEIVPYEDEFGNDQPFSIEEGELEQLKLSIQANGLEEAIKVRQVEPHKYMILGGHRRYEACKRLNYERIPAVIVDISDKEAFKFVCNNNVQRKKMPPSTFAAILTGYKRCGETVGDIADAYGMNRRTFYRYIHMGSCVKELQAYGDKKKIRLDAFEVLTKLNKKEQKEVAAFLDELDFKLIIDKDTAQEIVSLKEQGININCPDLYNYFYDKQREDNTESESETTEDEALANLSGKQKDEIDKLFCKEISSLNKLFDKLMAEYKLDRNELLAAYVSKLN